MSEKIKMNIRYKQLHNDTLAKEAKIKIIKRNTDKS